MSTSIFPALSSGKWI